MFLGTALATIPGSILMARLGRRPGFVLGAALGVLAGVLAALGLWSKSLALLAAGTFLVGTYQAFAQFYRFAAGEVADHAYRPRAISLVLAGGIVAALLGPAIGRIGSTLLPTAYAGSFLLLAAVSLVAALLLTRLRVPAPPAVDAALIARPLAQIVRQPTYMVALFAAATGYGVMILAMTATPIAMVQHHHALADATTVIQLHVLGMFIPSFFTGSLIARFGVLRIMLTGVALLAAHVLATLTGTGFQSFAAALMLLGVGWNFLYIGGTTLLTTTYTAAERGRAQAANDLAVFLIGLLSSLSAGALLDAVGWQTMNALLLPWLAIAAFALMALAWTRRVSTSAVA
jgi:MFS family permease